VTESDCAIQLADVSAGIGGFAVDGERHFDESGRAVAGAGDVNGDGLADLIVGASEAAPNDLGHAGRAYVVFGKADPDKVSLADVTQGIGGFALDGEAEGDLAGHSVSGIGDMNGDGLADVIVGAPGSFTSERSGRAYVVFGKASSNRGGCEAERYV
jgi:hypothetical protein